jgi:putative hydrolase of the HAD superfamily
MRTIRLKKPVRGIFFDLGWTLFRPAGNDWFICNKLIEYVGEEGLRNLPEAKKQAVFGRALKYLDDNHRLATEAEEYGQFVRILLL